MTALRPDRCATCKWWAHESTLATAAKLPEGSDPDLGVCQIAGPELYRVNDGFVTVFPAVRSNRFCSQWEPGSAGNGDGTVVSIQSKRKPAA